MRNRIKGCFTIDTEFSVGDNFEDLPSHRLPSPSCLGRSGGKEHGLGFLLDAFAEFSARVSFCQGAADRVFWRRADGAIARRITAAGHDVQLHLHPRWLHYETGRDSTARPMPLAPADRLFEFGPMLRHCERPAPLDATSS